MSEEVKSELIQKIIAQLGDNYNDEEDIISDYIDYYLNIASYYSNRDMNDEKLIPFVKTAVVMAYLRRGKEASQSNNEGGMSDRFIDIEDKLKKDIVSIRFLI